MSKLVKSAILGVGSLFGSSRRPDDNEEESFEELPVIEDASPAYLNKVKIEDITTVLDDIDNDKIDEQIRRIGFAIVKEGKPLGKGSFGQVRRAVRILDGEDSAVKIIELDQEDDYNREKRLKDFKNEITTLERLSGNPNIIKLLGHIIINSKIYIFMELADSKTLLDISKSFRKKAARVDEDRARRWFHEICLAVNFMHSRGFAHRDIKMQNILLKKPKRRDGSIIEGRHRVCKLSDFGLSRYYYDKNQGFLRTESYGGTMRYMAPEIIRLHPKCTQVAKAIKMSEDASFDPFMSDIWALGVTLFTLVSYSNPFVVDKHHPGSALKSMLESDYKYPRRLRQVLSQEVMDLIDQMLQPNANKRITFRGIFTHPWISHLTFTAEGNLTSKKSEKK